VEHDVEFAVRLDAARGGAIWALKALYTAHHPPLLRYLAARRPVDAVEVASSIWRDVAAALPEFDGDERAFRMWLLALARSRGRGEVHGAGIVRDLDPCVQVALEQVELLDADEAEVVLLQSVGGLTAEEVATVTGWRAADVRALQQRAVRNLIAGPALAEAVA
jgi:DNA-directed RNA polymerase specialized sigma24 family protein